MHKLIVPVILAGGQGTRLWPMSRAARPKQFLKLTDCLSQFQQTLARVSNASIYAPAIVMTNTDYRFIVAEQAAEVGAPLAGILLEPEGRNTGIAIAAAAFFVKQRLGEDEVLHILPSDHEVQPSDRYFVAIQQAAAAALQGDLVTFGLVPTHAETGYGYIKSNAMVGSGVAKIECFIEKPNAKRAEELLAQGGHFWNSGMFMMTAQSLLEECERLAPKVYAAAQAATVKAGADLDFVRLHPDSFSSSPNISIDYAIFEKTVRAVVIPVDFNWSDLGSWDAVWKTLPKDTANNAVKGAVTLADVTNSLLISDHAHIAAVGLNDIAVVATDDAIYVGKLSDAQTVGSLVKTLRNDKRTTHLTVIHKTAYRPWGGYSSVLKGERFQVKRLFVKPGKKLSLQKHHHRAEHWIVVRGTAEVTVDGSVTVLSENQSIYLPLGCTHRLANPGRIELELIEVQTGSYLGEDDIIRIEDEFGRA